MGRARPELRYAGAARRVRFLERPNRYLCRVEDPELGVLEAHVPNPGRLRELLPPGRTYGHIVPPRERTSPSAQGQRRTSWTLVDVEAPGDPTTLVSIDTGAARPLVDQALEGGWVRPVADWGRWSSEVPWGHHRFDHAVLLAGGRPTPRALLEVKSSNLREGPTALFPDAPTVRGASHVEALTRFVLRRGGRAALLFLVQRDDVREVRPYGAMDPRFARAVERARSGGVLILGRALHVTPGGALWGGPLPVRSPRWDPASDLAPPSPSTREREPL
ncbi:MAG: DNA/RNA nuclease SfsA [Euryarchaeota archaeon]|nr:DNA/RNA nuclease SfsA [Euryarchaeota archaeon]MDE1836136.1 DNA/RNA nuclease SfsA [Euryarchaeota archaeon]MDE1879426.1 DNA/RNA nuclease SfsA [Euryarchaeota archaeon]MDE2044114.1 DNA/RNA nuclease SfsA [Thermoplasmata archaeon]